MSANQPDIEQIRKYLNGELDARAMHQLEKQAQDDPFLMEALEGYEASAKNQQPNLNELKSRLQGRVKGPVNVLWRILPIAASLLIIGGLAWLWLSPKGLTPQLANNKQQAHPNFSIPAHPVSPVMQLQADSMIKARRATEQHSVRLATVRHHHANMLAMVQPPVTNDTSENKPSVTEEIANKSKSLDITEVAVNQFRRQMDGGIITGKITDTAGHPLPGARIIVKGSSIKAITNAKGEYSLPAEVNKDSVVVQMIGYETQHLALNGAGKLDIKLTEASNSLDVVEVTHKARPADVHDAQPQDGWKSYMAYLTQKAVMPDGQTGRVKLRFSVDTEGRISNIRVIRGRSDSMNRKAIELVMNGPKWYGPEKTNVDDLKQKEIKLKIKFHKA
ncbi:TonB family protein [uncultured Mucilaginibacter sp.]|uniref:TonB family protein n=1 Tax=uncultured Mucilaginibacter sp. TaxID=797541 RepID=UPI0025E0BDFE|nr:TonB family protein [uncultured Mucilaginibacter sp.]